MAKKEKGIDWDILYSEPDPELSIWEARLIEIGMGLDIFNIRNALTYAQEWIYQQTCEFLRKEKLYKELLKVLEYRDELGHPIDTREWDRYFGEKMTKAFLESNIHDVQHDRKAYEKALTACEQGNMVALSNLAHELEVEMDHNATQAVNNRVRMKTVDTSQEEVLYAQMNFWRLIKLQCEDEMKLQDVTSFISAAFSKSQDA